MPKRVKRNRLGRILLLLAMGVFLSLFIAILTITLLSSRVTEDLERLRESIRADGYPVTAEELNEWYAPGPGSEDAGEYFTELISRYDFELDDNEELLIFSIQPDIKEPLTNDQVALAVRHLQNNTDYLHDLHRLVDLYDSVRYPVEITEGWQADSKYLALVRKKTRMLSLEALVAANAGYKDKTTDALVGAFRVAETLRHEPTLIPQLVRVACLKIAFDASEQAINRTKLTRIDLEWLQTTLEDIDCDGLTQFGLAGERCFVNWAVQRYGLAVFYDEMSPVADWKLLMKLPGARPYMNWEELHAIETLTELMDVGNAEPFQRRELVLRVEHKLSDAQRLGNSFANNLAPATALAFEAENRIVAYLDTLSTGIAALRFSYGHERMPNDLQELVPEYLPEVPTDPFSGEPLRMRSDEIEFVVYSVGHDRDDDGGNPPPEGKRFTEDGDIVFRVLR